MSQLLLRLGSVEVPLSTRRSAARLISVPMFHICRRYGSDSPMSSW